MKKFGIDVSRHNGAVNWNAVKNSGAVQFVILRAGFGNLVSQKDSRFEEYYADCRKFGLPVGAYWYSYAVSQQEAIQEANTCLQVIQGKKFEYPIYFDIEEKQQFALGKAVCSAMAKAFCETLEKAGYFAGIYASKSNLESFLTPEVRARFAVWVAHYGVPQTTYQGNFGMWQKSSNGSVSGISGNVDLDECYLDYPAIIQRAGLNGYSKTAPRSSAEIQLTINGKSFSGSIDEN